MLQRNSAFGFRLCAVDLLVGHIAMVVVVVVAVPVTTAPTTAAASPFVVAAMGLVAAAAVVVVLVIVVAVLRLRIVFGRLLAVALAAATVVAGQDLLNCVGPELVTTILLALVHAL